MNVLRTIQLNHFGDFHFFDMGENGLIKSMVELGATTHALAGVTRARFTVHRRSAAQKAFRDTIRNLPHSKLVALTFGEATTLDP